VSSFITAAITFVLTNFSLSFLVLGWVVALAAIAWSSHPMSGETIVERLISWHVFFAIGAAYFYNFICHVFFGKMAASFIGWAQSPFQFEVGMASLGFAVVAFLAAFKSFDLRLAAIVGPALFSLGAAVGHVHQMVTAHDFSPGNAGVVFYMDIIVPLVGLVLLWLQHRYSRTGAAALE
jgi:hypothetical protein